VNSILDERFDTWPWETEDLDTFIPEAEDIWSVEEWGTILDLQTCPYCTP